ncbi:hypothetical protein [Novosphingobium guangzhouense]|uniref:Uncharacterized protein n=1 Tax=Novosphingobium guangzhouense TaxID=1850347 RepID=A0A2K2FU23_9SPHN|nr:hypothetical protein [Novosphingobium guangzhouense]PNU02295.1 hypothetical protein A8V01_26745 [Novosphingobium guangzhouense]
MTSNKADITELHEIVLELQSALKRLDRFDLAIPAAYIQSGIDALRAMDHVEVLRTTTDD